METNMKIKSTEYLQIDPMSEIFRELKTPNIYFFLDVLQERIINTSNDKISELQHKGWEVTDVKIKEDISACGDSLFMLIFEIKREVK